MPDDSNTTEGFKRMQAIAMKFPHYTREDLAQFEDIEAAEVASWTPEQRGMFHDFKRNIMRRIWMKDVKDKAHKRG